MPSLYRGSAAILRIRMWTFVASRTSTPACTVGQAAAFADDNQEPMSGLFAVNLRPQKWLKPVWYDKKGAAQQAASPKRTFGADNSE